MIVKEFFQFCIVFLALLYVTFKIIQGLMYGADHFTVGLAQIFLRVEQYGVGTAHAPEFFLIFSAHLAREGSQLFVLVPKRGHIQRDGLDTIGHLDQLFLLKRIFRLQQGHVRDLCFKGEIIFNNPETQEGETCQ